MDWCTRVGFRLPGRLPETGEPTWCELSRDGLTLQFLGGETPWPDPPAFTATLYAHPQSVLAVYEEIKDRIAPAWGPEAREWGTRELGLRDPSGYYITFTEPAD